MTPQEIRKFAHYMREGAKITEQTAGHYIRDGLTGIATCAMGAVALGMWMEYHPNGILVNHLIDIAHVAEQIRQYSCDPRLFENVVQLNDIKHWTREKIADHLDQIAEAEEKAQEPEEELVAM